MTLFEQVVPVLTGLVALVLIIGVPVYFLLGGVKRFALRPLSRCFQGIDSHAPPQPDDAVFVYHTYRGLLAWATQEEHVIAAAPVEAEILLGRLLRFNLTWGMLSYGAFFIPFLAVGSYFAQRRSIRDQTKAIEAM